MLKRNIWHTEHITTIVNTRQIFMENLVAIFQKLQTK